MSPHDGPSQPANGTLLALIVCVTLAFAWLVAPFFGAMFARLDGGVSGRNRPLSRNLADYLGSAAVTDRTDDDKTLLLAARI